MPIRVPIISEFNPKGVAESEKALKKFEGKAEESAGKVGNAGKEAGQSFADNFGGELTTFAKGGIAAGIGTVLAASISKHMDAQAGVKQLAGQFRLSAEQAAQYGDQAGELYARGWGEGLDEVQQAVGLTAQRLNLTTNEEITSITEGVLAASKTFGEENERIVRSVSQLLENDLAPSAEAALDLVVSAFQSGGNEAGDLLDTIDEYAQHWGNMGLSGEEALNQLVHGIQNGQRDTDKMADAIKTMRVRAVEDIDATTNAYGELGLNADEMRDKFLEGGDAAKEAFTTVIDRLRAVEDPVDQNRLAIQFLGTQYEDLGPQALESLASIKGELKETEGATKDLAETVKATDWEIFKRRGEAVMTTVGGAAVKATNEVTGVAIAAAGGVEEMGRRTRDLFDGGSRANREIVESFEASAEAAATFDRALLDGASSFAEVRARVIEHTGDVEAANVVALEWAEANKDASETLIDLGDKAANAAMETGDLTDVTEAQEEADRDAEEAAADLTEALEKQAEKTNDLIAARVQLVGGELGVREAQRQARASMEGLTDAIGDAEEGTDAYQAAIDDATESQLSAAEAAADYRAKQAEAAGVTLDAKDKAAILSEEINALAGTLQDGPVKDALLAYVEQLDAIPRQVDTRLNLSITGGDFGVGGQRGGTGYNGVRHVGGPVAAGQFVNVLPGEGFVAPAAGRIIPREDMARMAADGQGAAQHVTYNLYIQAPTGEAALQEFKRTLDEIRRRERGTA